MFAGISALRRITANQAIFLPILTFEKPDTISKEIFKKPMQHQLAPLIESNRACLTAALNLEEKLRFREAVARRGLTVNAFLRGIIAGVLAEDAEQKSAQMLDS